MSLGLVQRQYISFVVSPRLRNDKVLSVVECSGATKAGVYVMKKRLKRQVIQHLQTSLLCPLTRIHMYADVSK